MPECRAHEKICESVAHEYLLLSRVCSGLITFLKRRPPCGGNAGEDISREVCVA